mmetsp:Transcript_72850/g.202025  ORF Transcript_72850/g.202025 Transcript_72850/m.202025 type:complete len:134 (+) Transcript_72850:23-424(+)
MNSKASAHSAAYGHGGEEHPLFVLPGGNAGSISGENAAPVVHLACPASRAAAAAADAFVKGTELWQCLARAPGKPELTLTRGDSRVPAKPSAPVEEFEPVRRGANGGEAMAASLPVLEGFAGVLGREPDDAAA